MGRIDEFNEFFIRNTDDANNRKGCVEITAERRRAQGIIAGTYRKGYNDASRYNDTLPQAGKNWD